MVGNAQTIYDYIVSLLGTYSPYVDNQGNFAIDYTYIVAGVCLCIALYWCFKAVFTLLKALLGGGNYA